MNNRQSHFIASATKKTCDRDDMHKNQCYPTKQSKVFLCEIILLIALVAGCATVSPIAAGPRPEKWATTVTAIPGVPNLHRVNEALYRSAQPSKQGFAFLSTKASLLNGDRSIKTVLSLRAFDDDAPLVPTTSGLQLEQIRFKTWHPENEDVVKFLRIATTPAMQPVLVHCQHGSDRTGTMVAIYRIAVEGWSKAEAIDEMVNGRFGFHPMWANLRVYINELDVEAIKLRVAQQGTWK